MNRQRLRKNKVNSILTRITPLHTSYPFSRPRFLTKSVNHPTYMITGPSTYYPKTRLFKRVRVQHHSKETKGIPKDLGFSARTIELFQRNSLRSVNSRVTKTNKTNQEKERTTSTSAQGDRWISSRKLSNRVCWSHFKEKVESKQAGSIGSWLVFPRPPRDNSMTKYFRQTSHDKMNNGSNPGRYLTYVKIAKDVCGFPFSRFAKQVQSTFLPIPNRVSS